MNGFSVNGSGIMPEDPVEYVRKTRAWLDLRFDVFDEEGIYVPNQSSYGLSALAFRLEEYARCFALLRWMDRLTFESFLDVGCADGYMPGLVRLLFGVRVMGADLSPMAVHRADQLHGVNGVAAESNRLPFPDDSFELVLASEVLEHVVDPEAMVHELVRVASKYVVLTTPRAPCRAAVDAHYRALDPGEPHRHLHYFTDDDMRRIAGGAAILSGARTRWIGAIFHRFAWDDGSTLAQRKVYLAFTLSSATLDADTRRRAEWALIGRYQENPGWRKKILTPFSISRLVVLDAVIAAALPKTALDHLVLIPIIRDIKPSRRKLGNTAIVETMLRCFQVPPLRKEHIQKGNHHENTPGQP